MFYEQFQHTLFLWIIIHLECRLLYLLKCVSVLPNTAAGNVHNVNRKYCIHFWFSLFRLSVKEKTTLAALTVSEVLELFYIEALFLCILYFVNFLTRSRQPIHNGWVDAAQVKTQMYSKCLILLNKFLSVPEAGVLTEKWQSLPYDTASRDSWGLVTHTKREKNGSEGAPSSYSSSRREYIMVSLLVARDAGWQNIMFWSWSQTPQVCPSYRHMLY